jgi:NAD(P)-dependent dehydrogenase (short-subunit alcohol dehydrogenase family)
MVARRRGRVVNVGSMVGARDEPYVSAYACAKAAYFRLTGTLAAETAGHGVTVLCVSPGLVRTRMVEESLLGAPGRRWRPQIAAIPAEEHTPTRRHGDLLVRVATGTPTRSAGGSCMARTTSTSCWPTPTGWSPRTCSPLRLRERPDG